MPTDMVLPGSFQEAMDLAVLAVLETMFMTSIETVADWSGRTDPTIFEIVIEVRFEGAPEGQFRLHLEQRTATALASTMLCLEPEELTPERRIELTGELANMMCGRLLSDLEPEGILDLGTPVAIADTTPLAGATSRCFHLPEGALVAEFCLHSTEG